MSTFVDAEGGKVEGSGQRAKRFPLLQKLLYEAD
jgi:hypothetical protein